MKNRYWNILLLKIFFLSLFYNPHILVAQSTSPEVEDVRLQYSNTITANDLSIYLHKLASDEFEGRETGEQGQKLAAAYIAQHFSTIGIPPFHDSLVETDNYPSLQHYFQKYPLEDQSTNDSIVYAENVLGYIEGTDFKNEVLVISAHYDHLGRSDGIYYGADDDGSGTAAIMELAKAFMIAKKEGHAPRRSILFIAFSGEEKGLLGSKYYSEHPLFPFQNTVANLNIDMIGRTDEKHKENSNYIYLIGSNKLSSELHGISEAMNTSYSKLQLDYSFDKPKESNRLFYRSDHYNFAKNNVPVIFYFDGMLHDDYHKSTDTVDKINFEKMEKITRLIFFTAWELVNRNERIKLDKKNKFKE